MGIVLGTLLAIVMSAAGLVIAAALRCIDFQDSRSILIASVTTTVGAEATWVVWPVLTGANQRLVVVPGWWYFPSLYAVSFVLTTTALGVTSLVVSGLKIRRFAGLLAAGAVVEAVYGSPLLIQLVTGLF
jgi:hypothetical protein